MILFEYVWFVWTAQRFMDFFVSQDVFPGDFGPTYDKAIQTLMWLFLSRLEKLLPTQTLQQVNLALVFALTFKVYVCYNTGFCYSVISEKCEMFYCAVSGITRH